MLSFTNAYLEIESYPWDPDRDQKSTRLTLAICNIYTNVCLIHPHQFQTFNRSFGHIKAQALSYLLVDYVPTCHASKHTQAVPRGKYSNSELLTTTDM